MGKVLGIVDRTIATHLTRKAAYTKTTAQAGAVTLIQCFGGALNLNIHFHMIFFDVVYIDGAPESHARFRWDFRINWIEAGKQATQVLWISGNIAFILLSCDARQSSLRRRTT